MATIKQKKRLLYTSLASLTLATVTAQTAWAEETELLLNPSTSQAEMASVTESVVMLSTSQTTEFEPVAQTQELDLKTGVSEPRPEAFIANKDALPAGTVFSWKTLPDYTRFSGNAREERVTTSTSGSFSTGDVVKMEDKSGIVLVTYPDGTVDEVAVTLTLREYLYSFANDSAPVDNGSDEDSVRLTRPHAQPVELSHSDKVDAVLSNRIQNGTLAFQVWDNEKFAPILIEGEVGTEVDVTRKVRFKAMIPYKVTAPKSATNSANYDFGNMDDLDPRPASGLISGSGFNARVYDYSKTHQFFQPDRTYLSGLKKQLADYGLTLEVIDQVDRPTIHILPGGFVDYYYKHDFEFSQTYRITGTLRLPEGVIGQAETSWQNIFYEAKLSHRYGNGSNPPTALAFPGSDYSDLSYNFTYLEPALPRAETIVQNPDGTYTYKYLDPEETIEDRTRWGSINFGVEEVPLVTTVKIRASQPLAELYPITVEQPRVDLDATIDPSTVVGNKSELPENTTFTWVTEPETHLPGSSTYAKLRVTFSDGSFKELRVKVAVNHTQAQLSSPEGIKGTLLLNSSITPESLIANRSALPQGTRFTWALQPNLTRAGGKLAKVKVTYPDGSFEELTIRFTVR